MNGWNGQFCRYDVRYGSLNVSSNCARALSISRMDAMSKECVLVPFDEKNAEYVGGMKRRGKEG